MMHYILHHFNDAIMGSVMKDQHQNQTKVNRAQGKVHFYYKKRKCGIDVVFFTKFQTTWLNLSMKREAQFSIFIYNVKKQSQKYCVKFFALNCPRRFVLELHNFFW